MGKRSQVLPLGEDFTTLTSSQQALFSSPKVATMASDQGIKIGRSSALASRDEGAANTQLEN
jgi:hypothetical protein